MYKYMYPFPKWLSFSSKHSAQDLCIRLDLYSKVDPSCLMFEFKFSFDSTRAIFSAALALCNSGIFLAGLLLLFISHGNRAGLGGTQSLRLTPLLSSLSLGSTTDINFSFLSQIFISSPGFSLSSIFWMRMLLVFAFWQ
ncbi:hypothetical protein BpHYR1_048854 [Brachionus plicatilis]|uniref:Uncharacterized protein n=1 Tax=Brachionus plicatilis TaxID=10195 RepID=A0A3M7SLY4_BRAPC|nr:hypothetical protein BpHYR1_048854 [Brachionus plicatilis]